MREPCAYLARTLRGFVATRLELKSLRITALAVKNNHFGCAGPFPNLARACAPPRSPEKHGSFTKGPRGPFKGPRGPFKGPRGPFKGLRGPLKGPRGPFKEPRGPLKGPRGPLKDNRLSCKKQSFWVRGSPGSFQRTPGYRLSCKKQYFWVRGSLREPCASLRAPEREGTGKH